MISPVLVLFVCSVMFNVIQTAATEDTQEKCGPNEVFNDCAGCPIEDYCYDSALCPRVHPIPCSRSCVCKEGFIRKTIDTECIPKEECGTPCEIFEQYSECKQCANETCSSITNPIKCDGKEQSCTPGCACLEGYYRAHENSYCQYRCSCPELADTPYCVQWNAPFEELYSELKTHLS